jgi:hypothetical protein
MADQVIICPHCHREIPLTEAISHQIREQLRKEFDSEVKKKEEELTAKEHALSQRGTKTCGSDMRVIDMRVRLAISQILR